MYGKRTFIHGIFNHFVKSLALVNFETSQKIYVLKINTTCTNWDNYYSHFHIILSENM